MDLEENENPERFDKLVSCHLDPYTAASEGNLGGKEEKN